MEADIHTNDIHVSHLSKGAPVRIDMRHIVTYIYLTCMFEIMHIIY